MGKAEKNTEIRIRQLRKEYGDLVAVDDLSLEVYQGEILGFLGPNGAGKTTTINMLCGLLPPSGGEISFKDGSTLQGGHPGSSKLQISHRLGVCPQENVFWPKLTCKEQLTFMAAMYKMDHKSASVRANELLDFMGLNDKSNVQAKKLSGGMKRRLSIALALVHDPEFLVLDEPEAGLDPQSRLLVREFIKGLAGTKTIIVTTHNMDEADRLSDRVVIMDHGKLLLADTPENLKKTVGEGDILEFTLEDAGPGNQENVIQALAGIKCTAKFNNNELLVQSAKLIEKVAAVSELITSNGYDIQKMTLRENTLEDVFIYLTGRKLRQ